MAKLGGKYRDQVLADCSEAIANSVTMDGHLYGVPYTTNTWFMYYDKRVFFEEDVQSLEAMLEKGVVSFPFTNSWYLPAFYFGNGCTLFGDGTQEELGADFGGENAAAVTDYLVDLIANPHFVVDAVELAVYLGSAEAQKLRYELRSVIPSSVELENDPVVAADPVFVA